MSVSALTNQTASMWASSALGANSAVGAAVRSGSGASSVMARTAVTAVAASLQYVTANLSGSLASTMAYEDLDGDGSSPVLLFNQEQWSSGAFSSNNTNGSYPVEDEDDFVLPYSYPEMVLIAIVAGFLSLLTVAGNCMVMISFKIDKQLQTISNYFLFSLAVADFAIGLISMPLFTVYILAGRWQLGPYVCDTWLSLDYLASNASVLNLLIISFDR